VRRELSVAEHILGFRQYPAARIAGRQIDTARHGRRCLQRRQCGIRLIDDEQQLTGRGRYPIPCGAVDTIHRDPGLTGIRGWDAIIGGVASITGRDRVSDPAILDWCFEPDRYCEGAIFDPFGIPKKYFWTDYLRTPVELRVRNIVYPAGNLEGV
jgi:hypothetical protein